ncbi:nucleoside triphosphate hydrolase [Pseudomonas sp. URMO17WK12:I12]|uniref:nucleoside triphosphate hydrolase n=1 Tax=Pseudomonas sp. URMO17WK12:I12 TaxID=1259797 RepID=UPI00210B30DC|nr:nucleoside triphosphate hydrolase [Pseudomonas sp. URMO17WK12:I12]
MSSAIHNKHTVAGEDAEENFQADVVHPQLPFSDVLPDKLAPLIAFVGCDGAGKSTVSDAVLVWMKESREAQSCHLGIQSKSIGEALVKWPLVGPAIGRLIIANSTRGNPSFRSNGKGPSTLVALVIFLLSVRRLRRYQKMMGLRRRGIAVVADRFPQIAVANVKIDGPGLLKVKHRNGVVRFLAGCERTLYAYMISYRPDLVIRLNVDLETAFSRKPDHRYESLALKIASVPQLEYQGAPILDLDSSLPLEEVIARAKAAVSLHL